MKLNKLVKDLKKRTKKVVKSVRKALKKIGL